MFKKEKSLTLKILNAAFILQIVGLLIALIVQIMQIIFPVKYNEPSRRSNIVPTVIDNTSNNIDIRPIVVILLLIFVVAAVLFICNKYIKNFQVEKSSGLKLLTAISAVSIVEIMSATIAAIVYESLTDMKIIGILTIAVIVALLAPFIANLAHILDSQHDKGADIINAIMITILSGTTIALVNTLFYIDGYDCSNRQYYYCDQNSFTRTIVTEVVLMLVFSVIIYVIKKNSEKSQQAKILTVQDDSAKNLPITESNNLVAENNNQVVEDYPVKNNLPTNNTSIVNEPTNNMPTVNNDFPTDDEDLYR